MVLRFVDRYFFKQPRLRRAVCRVLHGNKDMNVHVLGTTLRINTVKEHGYLRASKLVRTSALLRDEVPTLLNLACLFADGDTFVDIGANVGVFCLSFARFKELLPNTRVYAFEANPDTFARLSPHARQLGIKAYNLAISDRDGTLDFVPGAVSHVFTTIDHANDYSLHVEPVRVPARRLDQLDIEGQSLILKVDVEGQERAVLEGARGLFDSGRIKAVYLDGYDDVDVEEFLKSYGFEFRQGRTLERIDRDMFSLLAVRSGAANKERSRDEQELAFA